MTTIEFKDRSQEWYEGVLANHLEEARTRVDELLAEVEQNEYGCLVTDTVLPRKVRFRGGQDRAYRFIFSILNREALTRHQVVRHRCHNRRCVNPQHLVVGTREDNLRDERERRANGVDFNLL